MTPSRAPVNDEALQRSAIARAYPGTVGGSVDWSAWLQRWDAQQQLHLPHREERFAAITDTLAAAVPDSPAVLDLGSGPGSLSVRVLQRLPQARIVAVDADPVLLAMGRGALAVDARIEFVDADLRQDWERRLPARSTFDAAVSTTALHWLSLPELVRVYATLARLLRPGAVFLNGDRLDFSREQQRIAAIAQNARSAQSSPIPDGAEDWDAWWRAVERDPGLAGAVAERRRRGHEHPHHQEPQPYDFHRSTLLAAGFSEVGSVWQRLADRVLIAVR
jgi:SAM-dependent methyltransferase